MSPRPLPPPRPAPSLCRVETATAKSSLLVAVDGAGRLCALDQATPGLLSPAELARALDLAETAGAAIFAGLNGHLEAQPSKTDAAPGQGAGAAPGKRPRAAAS